MNNCHLIITGEAGHGKDVTAAHLVANFGFHRVSFMDPARVEICERYRSAPVPATPEYLVCDATKETPDARLALKWCSDKQFVSIALKAYEKEDLDQFSTLSESERLALARSPRRIQQVYGTEYRCAQDPMHWIYGVRDICKSADFNAVISDGRKPLELACGDEIGATRIHIINPRVKKINIAHASEKMAPITPSTIVIMNDGSLELLYSRLDAVMDSHFNLAPRRSASLAPA